MEENKHSEYGIASFIISILSGLLIFLLIIIVEVMENSTPGVMNEEGTGALVVGIFGFLFFLATLLSLVLGIKGTVQKKKKKTFAIIGIVLSTLTIVGTIFFTILGAIIE